MSENTETTQPDKLTKKQIALALGGVYIFLMCYTALIQFAYNLVEKSLASLFRHFLKK